MQANDLLLALRFLFPDARFPEDVALSDDGSGTTISAWKLTAKQPTTAELAAALPAAQAKAQAQSDLAEAQAMLDERYRLFNRANASGNADDAAEIQSEIQEILAYMQEVRNAAGTP